jgi:hypothetical protein
MDENTSEIDVQYRMFALMLGHLFITFARLETSLASLLKLHLAAAMGGIMKIENVRLSSAIYGGLRFAAARDAIKRIAAAEDVSEKTVNFALGIFAQVGHIQDLRDKLAHHLVAPAYDGTDGYWQVTDAPVTRDIRKPKVYVFDSETLQHAAADLTAAEGRFGGRIVMKGHILQSLEHDLSPIPWRYKPSMLKLVPRSKLRAPPEPPLPPTP